MKQERLSERAVGFIVSSQDEKLSHLKPKDVAKTIGTRRICLHWAFKKKRNMSVRSFIDREILNRAIFTLEREPGISIAALAQRLGFSNTAEFEERFTKYILVKPGTYQQYIKMRGQKKQRREPM